jgi:hypothetical protein
VNYSFVDRFTFVHFGIGVVYGLLHLHLGLAAILAVAWEVVENPLKVRFTFLFPHATADTFQNSVGDIVAVLGGWLVCSWLSGAVG